MKQTELELLLAQYPDMLTVNEVATVLRVHPRSVQRWAHTGQVAALRVGRTYRLPKADVVRWLFAGTPGVVTIKNQGCDGGVAQDMRIRDL